MEEEEIEKRGVSCDCADNPDSDPKDMIKTGDGGVECKHCGRKKKSIDIDIKQK